MKNVQQITDEYNHKNSKRLKDKIEFEDSYREEVENFNLLDYLYGKDK